MLVLGLFRCCFLHQHPWEQSPERPICPPLPALCRGRGPRGPGGTCPCRAVAGSLHGSRACWATLPAPGGAGCRLLLVPQLHAQLHPLAQLISSAPSSWHLFSSAFSLPVVFMDVVFLCVNQKKPPQVYYFTENLYQPWPS